MLIWSLKSLYYLDAETGKILSSKNTRISRETRERYFIVPKLSKNVIIFWMKEFVEEMVLFDTPELGKKLVTALKKESPTKNFMDILIPDESGWIHGWSQWEADHIYAEIEDWFCNLPIDIEDDMSELDDDCPLCRMMKEGVTDVEIIKKGFREVNAKQMVDDMFEKINNKDK